MQICLPLPFGERAGVRGDNGKSRASSRKPGSLTYSHTPTLYLPPVTPRSESHAGQPPPGRMMAYPPCGSSP